MVEKTAEKCLNYPLVAGPVTGPFKIICTLNFLYIAYIYCCSYYFAFADHYSCAIDLNDVIIAVVYRKKMARGSPLSCLDPLSRPIKIYPCN